MIRPLVMLWVQPYPRCFACICSAISSARFFQQMMEALTPRVPLYYRLSRHWFSTFT
ncbi:hypothetical protein AGABI2DRAFT_150575 [Agaricus bisporus var. bisporus H97]|uniref:hypothetical protein n=1 Tax=Agaricus bisporus var. bisporus (strain H97 / ATCC MYA-4626 / FGSC 10389) TaxID=936046 RepID=UPI00029F4E98|nr:hypothetical protein AGABI2DRAFT_150575 [Agaricus bisporus var. bisporus H97]EKV47085.1 hypothetical protein AGABI2DRAFT_150575 [Agaricus bisporus var. bisporus H97]